MVPFLSEDFLLQTETAKRLFYEYAANMPIFDYHCHLPVEEIGRDHRFENLTRIWLNGDHYKWRALRACGIDEYYITGAADDWEKFEAWAAAVPKTLRNPLYHWTHMELRRPFGITDKLLGPDTAREIYDRCTQLLQVPDFSARGLLKQFDVRVVCTTDDPVDSLAHHVQLKSETDFKTVVLPAFRPDKAMAVEDPKAFNLWVDQLESAADMSIGNYESFMEAIAKRHDFFHSAGCRLSDHGLEQPYAEDFTVQQIDRIFEDLRRGQAVSDLDALQFKSAVLLETARMDSDKGWTQQFHLGALRNTNTRAFGKLGPDSGYDSMGDFELARPLARFLDRLEMDNQLAKTILYVLNPRDNPLIASMIGNFQDGSVPGKMQFGSGWWYNDQKDGMQAQIDTLSNMGLLSQFVGMLTDSRSFLSYPRHDYFRRILCNLLGRDMENGELPNDLAMIGAMVQDICYFNAVRYFGIEVPE